MMSRCDEQGKHHALVFRQGGLSEPALQGLLMSHREQMFAHSPEESIHALELAELEHESIRLFSLWSNEELAGCGALKLHSNQLGEIKSMKTATAFLRQGVAGQILEQLIQLARELHLEQLCLETGTAAVFKPAIALYKKSGFVFCGPFAHYRDDPFSCFMQLKLTN